jgi:hypothetical protein
LLWAAFEASFWASACASTCGRHNGLEKSKSRKREAKTLENARKKKRLEFVKRSQGSHWVGDGFPVRNLLYYGDLADRVSPFLLLDYAGPAYFPPTDLRLGVGEHPHRGFETVTIVYDGEVEHRDSSGGGGRIGPGEVQWMTAASGVVHEEFHGREFARTGGRFEMVQLWVNLPKSRKMDPPRYQGLPKERIPEVRLGGEGSFLRVIAGEFAGEKGPAETFSPVRVWDLGLEAAGEVALDFPEGDTVLLLVLRGALQVGDSAHVGPAELAVLEASGTQAVLRAREESRVLVLSGEPLGEPIVGHGPFVMTTEEEIRQAFLDYRAGRMGRLGGS